MGEENNTTRDPRRRLLKTIAAGGSAAGLAALPGKWAKPVVASVILPAHAQTSPGGCLGTVDNCPSGYSFSYNGSYGTDKSFSPSLTNDFPGVTWDGTTFSGSDSTQKYETGPPCASPCDDAVASKYLSAAFNFEGTDASFDGTFEYRCGGDPVINYTLNFSGEPGLLTGKYIGSFSYDVEGCYYLESSTLERQRGRRNWRNFRFGD